MLTATKATDQKLQNHKNVILSTSTMLSDITFYDFCSNTL